MQSRSSIFPLHMRLAYFALVHVVFCVGLVACGGGGNQAGGSNEPGIGNPAQAQSNTVTGIAAAGIPFSGTVILQDSSTPPKKIVTALSVDGSFSFDITSLRAPFLLKAVSNTQNSNLSLYSLATSAGTANINPLSNLAVVDANGGNDPATAANNGLLMNIGAMLPNSLTKVRAMFQPTLARFSVDTVNFITDPYIADHRGLDLFFDVVDLSVVGGNISVLNRTTGEISSGTTTTFSQHPLDIFTSTPSAGNVYVIPGTQNVVSLESFNVKALVVGTPSNAVIWGVVEPDGGSITSIGDYTAPANRGIYHIRATSAIDPSQSSTATVNVLPSFEQVKAWKITATINGTGEIDMATISGSRVYTAEGAGGVRIFDVSNPMAPRQIGSIPASTVAHVLDGGINRIVGVKVNGNIAAVSSVEGCTGLCTSFGHDLLQLYDVTDASNPRYLSSISTSGSTDIIFEGRYLYQVVYDRQTSGYLLQVIDTNDLTKPAISGTVPIRSSGWIIKLGDFIYASSAYGMPVTINVANPAKPTVLYTPDESFSTYYYAPYLAGFDHGLFVAGAQGNAFGVTLLDVIDPAVPKTWSKLTSIAGVVPFVIDHFLYTSAGITQYVYNIADPANPNFVTSVTASAPIKMSSFNNAMGVVVTSEVVSYQGGAGVVTQGAQLNFLAPGR
jgi:hypothetical protein